jgi:streptogramin lyase
LLDRQGPLEPARALELCSQVAEALDTAHAIGLVHRDVKPANVLVTEEGGREHCYLSDFGLARDQGADAGAPTHLSGTVDYTAPEQIGHEPAGASADVYSLACVLYECLAGEPPFRRARPTATLFAHTSELPPSLHEQRPDLPEAIDPVIAKALAKDPDERYESCRELTEAAREALGLAERGLTRRQLVLLATGAALAVAAAAAIPAILLGGGSDAPIAAPPTSVLPVTEDSLVRIDPETGEAVAALAIGSRPVGVAAGEGAVWVIGQGDRSLSQIDPETNAIVRTVSLPPGESPEGIVAGEGAVWTRHAFGLRKYDPATSSFPALPNEIAGGTGFTNDIAAGHGSIWLFQGDEVLRLDPATGRIVARVSIGQELLWLAIGEDAVWLADGYGLFAGIDRATNRATPWAEVSESLHGVAAGEGAVWAINSDEDLVLRLDPATLRVTDRIRVGRSPTAIAAGAGGIWVTSERDRTLTRIDPTTFDVQPIALGGAATDVAVGESAVWVTVDVR